MQQRFVIKPSSLPSRLPISFGLLVYLVMEHFHAAGWVQGIVWTLYALLFIGAAICIWNETHVDAPGFGKRS